MQSKSDSTGIICLATPLFEISDILKIVTRRRHQFGPKNFNLLYVLILKLVGDWVFAKVNDKEILI